MGVYPQGSPMVGWRMGTLAFRETGAGVTSTEFKSLVWAPESCSDLDSNPVFEGDVRQGSTFRVWPLQSLKSSSVFLSKGLG